MKPLCDIHPIKPSNVCRKCKTSLNLKLEEQKKVAQEFLGSGDIVNVDYNSANKSGVLQIHGDSSTFNLNDMLVKNILNNSYYKALFSYKSFEEVVENLDKVTYIEAWGPGGMGMPSYFMCALYRLMMMRLTEKQLTTLMKMKENPFLRCLGFVYIRYCADPNRLWEFFEPFIGDPQEVSTKIDGSEIIQIGTFVEHLLIEKEYYGTYLSRIPILIYRELQKKLSLVKQIKEREKKNLSIASKFQKGMETKFFLGDDEENWFDGIIEEINLNDKLCVVALKNEVDKESKSDSEMTHTHLERLKELEKLYKEKKTVPSQREIVPFGKLEVVISEVEKKPENRSQNNVKEIEEEESSFSKSYSVESKSRSRSRSKKNKIKKKKEKNSKKKSNKKSSHRSHHHKKKKRSHTNDNVEHKSRK